MTFDTWKARVNVLVESKLGLSTDDLPDMDYYSEFEAGTSPAEMADMVLSQAQEDYDAFCELGVDW